MARPSRSSRDGLDLSNELAEDMPARRVFEEQLVSVFAKNQSFSVRETKDSAGIELLEKIIENVSVELEEVQRRLYERFRTELCAEVVRDGELVIDDADEILKRLLRLVQVAANPRCLSTTAAAPSRGKLAPARRTVEAALKDDSKVILWTGFIDNAEWLARQFSDKGSIIAHGNNSIADRNAAIDGFASVAKPP